MQSNSIASGQDLLLNFFVENIGTMKSVDLSVPYDKNNFKFSEISVNGIQATATDSEDSVHIAISKFNNTSNGNKLTLKFYCEPYASSKDYSFTANYCNLVGVDRILIKETKVTVKATDVSDTIVIFADDPIVSSANETQLIIPLFIKHNTGLLGYTLSFEYDAAVLDPVSAKAGNSFSG